MKPNLSSFLTINLLLDQKVQCFLSINQLAFLILQCYFSPAYFKFKYYKNYVNNENTGLQSFCIVQTENNWYFVTIFGFFFEEKFFTARLSEKERELFFHDRLFSLKCFFDVQNWAYEFKFDFHYQNVNYGAEELCVFEEFSFYREKKNSPCGLFFPKTLYWNVWLEEILLNDITAILFYFPTQEYSFLLGDLKFKDLISNFCFKNFIVCFDEMYDSKLFLFYKLQLYQTKSKPYIVKNKNNFFRFCKLKVVENKFLCYGIILEPLFDFVLIHQLISFCGRIKLPKTKINDFIYNLMQFILPSLHIICSVIYKDKKAKCLYFWFLSNSILSKNLFLKHDININMEFKEQNSIDLTKKFITSHMYSKKRNLPINCFFVGLYQNYSFLRLFEKTVYIFIKHIGKIQNPFDLYSEFDALLEKEKLFGDEWLFFAPQMAIKEHSIIETISTVE